MTYMFDGKQYITVAAGQNIIAVALGGSLTRQLHLALPVVPQRGHSGPDVADGAGD